MFAAISPRDNQVGLIEGDNIALLDGGCKTLGSVSSNCYLSRYPDTMVAEVHSAQDAIRLLEEQSTKSLCLDMMLLLFDAEVSTATRHELAGELNELLDELINRIYVLDIILSKPLPIGADTHGAENAAIGYPATTEVVRSIVDSQDWVSLIFDSWLKTMQESIVMQSGTERVFAVLSMTGVFRNLALHARDKGALEILKPNLTLNKNLNSRLQVGPRIVLALVNALSHKLPHGPSKRSVSLVLPQLQDDDEPYDEGPQHLTGHEAWSAALTQIKRVSELYIQQRDPQANSILQQLIHEQCKHPNGEVYLVKSLTNIATHVGRAGRPDVSLDCLKRALDYPGGIDARLYLEIGNGMREADDFDEALSCYEHAYHLDDGSLASRIRLAMIRVMVAKGNYDKALAEYSAIPDLQLQSHALAGLGTLYRKMGRLRESRNTYRQCLDVDGDMHLAYAGLAEIRKQSGNAHAAIAEYNSLFRRFGDLEMGAMRAYRLAQSHLLRLTQQYDKSESILRQLLARFPADQDTHLQFAKLLELCGNHVQAEIHFAKATQGSIKNLAQLIFAKASRRFDTDVIQHGITTIQHSLKPEEQGLASCLEAFHFITIGEYNQADLALTNVTFLDKMVRDCSEVLRFHARKGLFNDFSYKSSHNMCRVAKGCYRTLRNAMQLIQDGAFSEAEALESEFLLRVAA